MKDKPQTTHLKKPLKRKGGLFRKLVIFIVLILTILFLVKTQRPDLIEKLNKEVEQLRKTKYEDAELLFEESNEPQDEQTVEKENLTQEKSEEAEESLTAKAASLIDSVISFGSDETQEEKIDDPYEQIVEDQEVKFQTELEKKRTNYHAYVANADQLIAKFKLDMEYADELQKINQLHEHPEKIENMIKSLEEYNALISSDLKKYEEVSFSGFEYLSKFIKVKKVTETEKERKKLKEQIQDKLPEFALYLNSEELRERFLK